MKRPPLTAISIFLSLIVVCGGAYAAISGTCDLYFSDGVIVKDVPLANTADRRERGLSGRENPGVGMLFSWGNSEPRAFTMHGVNFPLSIGFLANDGTLFAVEDMAVNSDRFYLSMRPATDAIELALGQFEVLGLSVGSKLTRRECRGFD